MENHAWWREMVMLQRMLDITKDCSSEAWPWKVIMTLYSHETPRKNMGNCHFLDNFDVIF